MMRSVVNFALVTIASLGAVSALPASRSVMEADVLDEVNFLRGDPAAYADELDALLTRFEGRILRSEDDNPDLLTNEGPSAVAEAARELRLAKPLSGMEHAEILAKAAADHVRHQGASGEVGHYSDGKGPGDRVKARGGNIYVGEVIVYGTTGPQNAVQQLVIDDGVANRGHRKLLMTGRYRYAGVACGDHKEWRNMCVIVLSETIDGSPQLPEKGK